MQQLFSQLGIDGKLLLAQALNFLLVLTILRLTVYKPLGNILRVRREKIKQGIEDAEQAQRELEESELVRAEKLAEAHKESLQVLHKAEVRAKSVEGEILKSAHQKEADIVKNAEMVGKTEVAKEKARFYEEAKDMVRTALARTAELDPQKIDDALINQVLIKLKK